MAKEIKLSEFLKENDAYNRFINNFDRSVYNYITGESSGSSEVEILNAFDWGYSSERFNYWNKLDDRWSDIDDDLKVYDMDWLLEKGENK